ncbi:SixA phosphatase family protein [Neptunomonas qingdaonensis]|uniref:Phosphohistidine phosphatase n=1 Tax=Neptunomonas qingdaonensis TaxID=1045558 RepID=A0A1I2TXE3_9GAMM|nr:histidine phosphatase family protein [Neptunomonas qingdaonensis]SFG69443.1 phosphohistidine phosphatase [Neptunomonas qingdaonensis]
MRTITLIRHAKSSWKNPDIEDFNRPLNKRGKRDLPAMAERLKNAGLTPDKCLSSGATRAFLTAKATSKRLPNRPLIEVIPELYDSCMETLLDVLQRHSDKDHHVMVFGHNPGLQRLGEYLSAEQIPNLPTCGVMHIHLGVTCWSELSEGCGTLEWFDYPKLHQKVTKKQAQK